MNEDRELTVTNSDYSLVTDLYQLTMAACYVGENIEEKPASFEMFVRSLPEGFGYIIAAGLAQAREYLEKFCFSEAHLEALKQTGIFDRAPDRFWSVLRQGSFTGDVWAVPEGTAIFANEPLLRVEAPLWQAQLVETYLLNTINYQSLIATKAARMRDAAGSQVKLLEFGSRRAFSPQGAVWAARAAIAGGMDGTSNVLAALKLGRSPSGTMAHSLVMAFKALSDNEDEAFLAFERHFDNPIFLIDTYDTVAAAERLAQKAIASEVKFTGVRLDSGDLAELSKKVRHLLPDINIFASGDIDEWEITRLKESGASIDGYGVGTKLVTGNPVNGVYKLVEIDGIPTMKESSNKVTYPGRKQIFRRYNDSLIVADRLGLATEKPENDERALLQLVIKDGKPIKEIENLETISGRTAATVASLPQECRQLDRPTPITVEISQSLEQLRLSVTTKQCKDVS